MSIATIRGDLSNITAPPFILADKSAVEFPQYWAENSSLFLAPASEPDPAKRALLVLKWFLGSLKSQQYAGNDPNDGVKKPLNAFLGELFVGHWDHANGRTNLISEQVSHHPPVTATVLWDDKAGIRAEGFTRQKITFSGGSVTIKQIGHAVLTLDKLETPESYLIPLPDVKISGILSGTLYPELHHTYKITSSTGYTSTIDFSGRSMFGFGSGAKNSVSATLTRDTDHRTLYTVSGQWISSFVIHDHGTNTDIETYHVPSTTAAASGNDQVKPITTPSLTDQSPWESRRAWADVIAALRRGDMRGVSDAKGKIERAQREMRKDEERMHQKFEPLFFHRAHDGDKVVQELMRKAGRNFEEEERAEGGSGGGMWKVNWDVVRTAKRPFRDDGTTPLGRTTGSGSMQDENRPLGRGNDLAGTRDQMPMREKQNSENVAESMSMSTPPAASPQSDFDDDINNALTDRMNRRLQVDGHDRTMATSPSPAPAPVPMSPPPSAAAPTTPPSVPQSQPPALQSAAAAPAGAAPAAVQDATSETDSGQTRVLPLEEDDKTLDRTAEEQTTKERQVLEDVLRDKYSSTG